MIALSLLMLAAGAFGGAADPELPVADVFTPELLAQVIGEAGGAGVWGSTEKMSDAWRHLMHVAVNRRQDWGWPPANGPLKGFYRLDPAPPPEAIKMARDVLTSDEDITGGCLYALSAQDLGLLGIERQGDVVLRGNSVFELHFFKRWYAE